MSIHTKDELLAEIQPTHAIPLTIGLDQGYLLITDDAIQFIAQRFGGWDVVENYKRVDFVKTHTESNFMGTTVTLNFQNGRLHCKNIPDGVDLPELLTGVVYVRTEKKPEQISVSAVSPVPTMSNDDQLEGQELVDLLDKFLQSETTKSKTSTRSSPISSESSPKTERKSKERKKNSPSTASENTPKTPSPTIETQKPIDILNIPEPTDENKGIGCGTMLKYLFWLYIIFSVLASVFE